MKIVKLLLCMVFLMFLTCSITSCGSFRRELLNRDAGTIANERFDEIITSLQNGDVKNIKDMFSINALNEDCDMDEGIEYLLQIFKGNIKSKECGIESSNLRSGGYKTTELKCKYVVKTDVDTYIVFFKDKLTDTENAENVGLNMLQIIKESEAEEHFDWGGDKTNCLGIYRTDIIMSE